MKYIDAGKLLAEIKIIQQSLESRDVHFNQVKKIRTECLIECCKCIIDTITSLQQEQPEVDLEKELQGWRHNHFHGRRDKEADGEYLERDSQLDIAKHFFELGVNASNPLTWRYMAEIDKIANLLETEWLNSTPWDGIRDCGFYQEVLKRFKAQKGE